MSIFQRALFCLPQYIRPKRKKKKKKKKRIEEEMTLNFLNGVVTFTTVIKLQIYKN